MYKSAISTKIYLSIVDLILLGIHKVILRRNCNEAVVYFQHYSLPMTSVFVAILTFHITDYNKHNVSIKMNEAKNVVVSAELKRKVKQQLLIIFSKYFDDFIFGTIRW